MAYLIEAHLRATIPTGSPRALLGAVSCVLRFCFALNRHVHVHCGIVDSLFDPGQDGQVVETTPTQVVDVVAHRRQLEAKEAVASPEVAKMQQEVDLSAGRTALLERPTLRRCQREELIPIALGEAGKAPESGSYSSGESIYNRSLCGRASPAESSGRNSDMVMMGGSENTRLQGARAGQESPAIFIRLSG